MNINKSEFLELVKAESVARKSTTVPVDKEKLRKQLENDVAEFLAKGGEIKQAEIQTYQAKHGTNTQYIKHSCRCKVCIAWALKNGRVKTEQLRGVQG